MRNYFDGFIYFLEQEPKTSQQSVKQPTKPSFSQSIPSGGSSQSQPMDPSMDPSLEPLPEEEPLDFTEIGKVFVLKKIYVKLLSIDTLLKNYTEEKFDKLKEDVEEVIDMFHTVVSNIDKIKDELDDYIKLFQDFTLNAIKKLDSINNKEE